MAAKYMNHHCEWRLSVYPTDLWAYLTLVVTWEGNSAYQTVPEQPSDTQTYNQ